VHQVDGQSEWQERVLPPFTQLVEPPYLYVATADFRATWPTRLRRSRL
jgi:hypothetical protein